MKKHDFFLYNYSMLALLEDKHAQYILLFIFQSI